MMFTSLQKHINVFCIPRFAPICLKLSDTRMFKFLLSYSMYFIYLVYSMLFCLDFAVFILKYMLLSIRLMFFWAFDFVIKIQYAVLKLYYDIEIWNHFLRMKWLSQSPLPHLHTRVHSSCARDIQILRLSNTYFARRVSLFFDDKNKKKTKVIRLEYSHLWPLKYLYFSNTSIHI